MQKERTNLAKITLQSLGLAEVLIMASLLLEGTGDNPLEFWAMVSFLIFFFSLAQLFTMILMKGKNSFSPVSDILLLISAMGILMSFLVLPLMHISVWAGISIALFYTLVAPILMQFFNPLTMRKGIRRNMGWLDILMVFMMIYLLGVGIYSIAQDSGAEPSFYSNYDELHSYMSVKDDSHVEIHIFLVNRGFSPAKGLEIQHNGSTVYSIDELGPMELKEYVFTMELRGEPYNDTYWEAVYGPDGEVTYVQRNITRYIEPNSVDLRLLYQGEIVDYITLYRGYGYYDYYD